MTIGATTTPASRIMTTPPGPIARAILERDSRVLSPSYARDYGFVMDHGLGAEVWDVDRNRYIDFSAGIAVNSTGHCHPRVVAAIQQQAAKLLHMSGTDFYYAPQGDLAKKVRDLAARVTTGKYARS